MVATDRFTFCCPSPPWNPGSKPTFPEVCLYPSPWKARCLQCYLSMYFETIFLCAFRPLSVGIKMAMPPVLIKIREEMPPSSHELEPPFPIYVHMYACGGLASSASSVIARGNPQGEPHLAVLTVLLPFGKQQFMVVQVLDAERVFSLELEAGDRDKQRCTHIECIHYGHGRMCVAAWQDSGNVKAASLPGTVTRRLSGRSPPWPLYQTLNQLAGSAVPS